MVRVCVYLLHVMINFVVTPTPHNFLSPSPPFVCFDTFGRIMSAWGLVCASRSWHSGVPPAETALTCVTARADLHRLPWKCSIVLLGSNLVTSGKFPRYYHIYIWFPQLCRDYLVMFLMRPPFLDCRQECRLWSYSLGLWFFCSRSNGNYYCIFGSFFTCE